MTTATYNAKDITVLEGLEPVRKRPGMYIGGVGSAGLHHLVWEILDNSVDEAMNGHASEITVTLHANGTSITVVDNGRGMPVDVHPKTKKSGVEVIFTILHAGGKFEHDNYKTAGGLHGVGASVVNALSKDLVATIKRDGHTWEQRFKQGKPQGPIKKIGPARGTGSTVFFQPDPTIFPKTEFDPNLIRERLEIASYIHKGLKVIFEDEVHKQKYVYLHEDGLVAYLAKILKDRAASGTPGSSGSAAGKPIHETPFTLTKENGIKIDLALQWTESTDECVRSYVNGIPTSAGGTHENGLRSGIGKAVRNFIETHNLTPKGVTLAAEDIREGVVAVMSVFIAEVQFQGQTKERLNNPEVQAQVDSAVRPGLEQWLNSNQSIAEGIVARIVLAARAREASRAASQAVSRRSATSGRATLPGKLADCHSRHVEDTELFIVEGDSAGGSAKQGRDRDHQAILPLRGKVLNTEQASLAKVLENKELADVVTAFGCGIGKDLDVTRLRYGKIIFLADADSDGNHITTLLLTFVFRHMRGLIEAGRIFLAQPPLYRIDIGKETFWALDDAQRDQILAKHASSNGAAAKGKAKGAAAKGEGEVAPAGSEDSAAVSEGASGGAAVGAGTSGGSGGGASGGRRGKAEITRFKGLGEMMPAVLWQTTLNPKTRRLLRVEIADALETDKVIQELMGKDASARFHFIMDRAEEAEELDL